MGGAGGGERILGVEQLGECPVGQWAIVEASPAHLRSLSLSWWAMGQPWSFISRALLPRKTVK